MLFMMSLIYYSFFFSFSSDDMNGWLSYSKSVNFSITVTQYTKLNTANILLGGQDNKPPTHPVL